MPPEDSPIPRFVAEAPQEPAPFGRWAQTLSEHFLDAWKRVDTAGDDVGDIGEILWFPSRGFCNRIHVPATASTSNGYELFGYVSYSREHDGAEAAVFRAAADYTDETAQANPGWTLDLSDREIGSWRDSSGQRAEITLVWGAALVAGGASATAELGSKTTDQSALVENRFTLVSLDNYAGDFLEVKLWAEDGSELAAESLYEPA